MNVTLVWGESCMYTHTRTHMCPWLRVEQMLTHSSPAIHYCSNLNSYSELSCEGKSDIANIQLFTIYYFWWKYQIEQVWFYFTFNLAIKVGMKLKYFPPIVTYSISKSKASRMREELDFVRADWLDCCRLLIAGISCVRQSSCWCTHLGLKHIEDVDLSGMHGCAALFTSGLQWYLTVYLGQARTFSPTITRWKFKSA